MLIPLVRIKKTDYILFEIRSPQIRQGGEVCFPGGKVDPQDTSNIDAAIRETEEELGLERKDISLLGALGTFVNVTGFSVDAYVGKINVQSIDKLQINRDEVESVFVIPVDYFMKTEPEEYKMNVEVSPYKIENGSKIFTFPADKLQIPGRYIERRTGYSYPVYVYKTEKGTIWGITAFLIKVFINKLR